MAAYPTSNRVLRLRTLPVDRLERGNLQPRKAIDGIALKKLAESIQEKGVIQPICVRKVRHGRFEILAGERRWRAAKMAGLRSIPTVVTDVPDAAALAIALIENLHREDLNPIDQATAIQQLIEEFAMTHREVAETVAKSRATITNLLRLLELPHDAQKMVAEGKLTMGHARALLALPSEQRQGAAEYVAKQGLSVRAVERMARRRAPIRSSAESNGSRDPAVDFPEPVRQKLERTVELRKTNDGRWRLSFSFSNLDELREKTKEVNGLVEQIGLPL